MKTKKRVISFVLSVAILIMSFADFSFSHAAQQENTEKEPVTIIACSDYQNNDGNEASSANVKSILSQMTVAGYDNADGFLAMGDYDQDYIDSADTEGGITSLKETIKSVYTDIDDDKMIFVQGNHDNSVDAISKNGANDTEDYGVYVIGYNDYTMNGGTQDSVNALASDLDSYLRAKADAENEQPIFVLSHVPLHYSHRTYREGQGLYGEYIVNVLNEYGEQGLNIIYMFGHNHNSWGYDDYLGTGSVYLTQGDTIYVAQPGEKTATPNNHELQFTYMNAGYIGYNNSGTADADTTLTMTVFQIRENLVTVERYSASGVHNLKSTGHWSNNPKTVGDNYVETKDTFGADDSYLAKVYRSPQTIIGDVEMDGNVQVATSANVELRAEERMSAKDVTVHNAYVSYEIEAQGYIDGAYAIVCVNLPEDGGFDKSKPVYLTEKTTGTITAITISEGQVRFTTEHLGDFELAQFKALSSISTPKTVYKNVYTLADNKNYVIASAITAGDAYAMQNSSGETITSAPVEIQSDSNGTYIETSDNTILWKFLRNSVSYSSNPGDLQNQYTERYLSVAPGVESPFTVTETGQDFNNWGMSSSQYMYSFENLDVLSSEKTRYVIQYDDANKGFETYGGTSNTQWKANKVYLFEETSIPVENAVYMDSVASKVQQGATGSDNIGSNIIFTYADGTTNIVPVTVSMLKDAQGNPISTSDIGLQTGISVYYDGQLVYDNYKLSVYGEYGYNYLNISEYRAGDTYTAPTERGYVFAGWYTDKELTKPLGEGEKEGYAYAKFVHAEVLEAMYQVATGAQISDSTTSMRLVTSVDSRYYKEVGFELDVDQETLLCMSNNVYNKIVGVEDGVTYTYEPDDTFDITSEYFMVFAISDIPKEIYEKDITVRPKWITLDGTEVFGIERVINILETLYEPNIYKGISFESSLDESLLYAGNYSHSVKNLKRVKYADYGITGGTGDYGMRAEKAFETSVYPRFYINFGETIPQGAILTFKMYLTSQDSSNKYYVVVQNDSKTIDINSGSIYQANQWVEVKCQLTDAASSFYVYAFTDNLSDDGVAMFVDDFSVISLEYGVGFEREIDLQYFSRNLGTSDNNMTSLEVVDYTSAGIPKETGSGEGVLKGGVRTGGYNYPRFYMDLGQEVPAGSILKFRVYVPSQDTTNKVTNITSQDIGKTTYNILASTEVPTNEWTEVSITLGGKVPGPQQQLYVYFYVGYLTDKPAAIYMDNFELIVNK